MGFNELLDRVWFFDFEVFRNDWLLVLISYKDRKEIVFHNSSVNDVQDFIDNYNPILVGYNAKYYDSYILKGILAGFNNEELYDLNNHLISGKQGWEYDFGGYVEIPDIWDLIQDIVPMKSLKEIEGNLGMDITETTIPFNLPTKWTQKEYEEVLYYCEHDVEALIPLFEIRKGYFKTKYDLCTLAKIDYSNIGLTNAKLVAKFLGAKMVERDDERDYVMPNIIDKHYIQKEILDFFAKIWDTTIPSHKLFGGGKDVNKTKANEGMSLEITIDGVVCVYRWGGTHSARPNYEYDDEVTPEIIVINCDFSSLYPHLLALPQYNFISRNIPDKDAYLNVLKNRLRLKAEGKKEEQLPLKLVLNTTYGCENNRYNDLYDPRGARGTCITGQLLLTELMNKILSIKDCHLVQTNTDGVMVSLPKESLDEYYRICNEFVKKCGIELEYDIINKISQRDVNNYCMLYGDRKKIKAKGGCFSALPDIKVTPDGLVTNYKPDFKANSLSIVAEAVLKNLLFNIPVEETINNCDDLMRFQTISHLGHTYEKMVQESENGDIELQRNNRVYAGVEPSGTLIKVKHDGRRDSLANCPTNPIVDNKNEITIDKINKQWYINLAKLRVNDFKGVKRLEAYKKEELLKYCEEHNIPTDKKMKKSEIIKIIEELENNKQTKKEGEVSNMNIYQKINELRKRVRQHNFIMDKELPSNLGGGEYASIGQYYDIIQNACVELGLDFSWEVQDVISFEKGLFKPQGKPEQHVWTVKCLATFVDIENGDKREYIEIGSGSDICDKGVSGASTLAFRNWFDKNFSPNNNDDENVVNEEVKTEAPKVPTYVPPQKKEAIKEEVVNTPQQQDSDKAKAEEIAEKIMEIRELSGNANYGASVINAITSEDYTSADCLEWSLKIQDKLDSLKGE